MDRGHRGCRFDKGQRGVSLLMSTKRRETVSDCSVTREANARMKELYDWKSAEVGEQQAETEGQAEVAVEDGTSSSASTLREEQCAHSSHPTPPGRTEQGQGKTQASANRRSIRISHSSGSNWEKATSIRRRCVSFRLLRK